ncbi:sperm-associated antigen 8 [Dendropsophus ebraccatus]|uniref:sperm-associated antigen 8 n=1 Tax=Dendropsophus ebraccatus TaxID=150705 RepID=UPI003831E04E
MDMPPEMICYHGDQTTRPSEQPINRREESRERQRRRGRSRPHSRISMEDPASLQEGGRVGCSPCLLDNWQEERSTVVLDKTPSGPGVARGEQDHRHGHKGIISTQLVAEMATSTTHQDSYRRPSTDSRRHTGLREEQLRRELYQRFSQDIREELRSPTKEMKVTESTTKRDHQVAGFVPQIPAPRKKHDYRSEQAVTFWAENVHAITGVSDIRTSHSPFKRSSAFTTPISDYLDQPVPYSLENYPNM